jgi:hypothetical protein
MASRFLFFPLEPGVPSKAFHVGRSRGEERGAVRELEAAAFPDMERSVPVGTVNFKRTG